MHARKRLRVAAALAACLCASAAAAEPVDRIGGTIDGISMLADRA